MQPPLTSEELAEMYPDLEPWQRDELEVWHRGWITKLMTGEAFKTLPLELKQGIPNYIKENVDLERLANVG